MTETDGVKCNDKNVYGARED